MCHYIVGLSWIIEKQITFKQFYKLYIYTLHIYKKCQLVWLQIYMNKKKTQNLLKLQIFIFFSEALSMRNQITNEDNSATY